MVAAPPPADARRGWAFSPLGFVRRVAVAAYEDNVFFLASALSFDALLALLPFILLSLAGIGYFLHTAGGETLRDLGTLLGQVLPARESGVDDPFARVEQVISTLVASRGQLSLYGVPFFLWFATRLFSSVRAALNEVFDIQESRPWIIGLAQDLFLVVASAALFAANAGISASSFVPGGFQPLFGVVSGFGFGVILFFMIYSIAPSRTVSWDTALIAAGVASLAFELMKRLFALYLSEFATLDRLYSNANVIAVLLFVFWVYYTACVFLIGGEVAETYDLARRQRAQRAILT